MKYEIIFEDPAMLFGELVGTEPFNYQYDFLLSKSKRVCFRSGRQIGKTTLSAVKAIYHAINNPNSQIIIVSKSQEQAGIMFRKIRTLCQHEYIKEKITRETYTMIFFGNGSEIHCRPGNNPDAIRGYSPTLLIIDEAHFVKEELFISAEAGLAATDGNLILISTTSGKTGRFYEAFQSDLFEKYHVKSEQCPLISKQFLEEKRRELTEIEFLREYEGEFISEQDTLFTREEILNIQAEIPEATQQRDTYNYDYYLGVDIARFGTDETVYTINEVNRKDQGEIVFIKSTKKLPLTDVIGRVKQLSQVFDFKAVYVDESGLGAGAVDSLKESGIRLRNIDGEIGGIPFTLQNKDIIYKNLKLLVEQKRIKIPYNDRLFNQLVNLRKEYSESGLWKIHHPDRGYDDFCDSLALACLGMLKRRITGFAIGGRRV